MNHRQRLDGRCGVTLLEVLISIGVMAVGLMGMASLIPLGRLELAEADKLDNSSALGRAAFRELTVRGYLRPEMWVDPITGKTVAAPSNYIDVFSPTPPAQSSRQYRDAAVGNLIGPPYAPLVIDPLMIAPKFFGETVNAASLNAQELQHRTRANVFPFSINLPGVRDGWPEATAPKIARVTLRSIPPGMAGVPSNGPAMGTTMRYDTAARYFAPRPI